MYILRNVVHEKYGQCDTCIYGINGIMGLEMESATSKCLGNFVNPKPPQINFPRIPAWVDVAMRVRAFFNIVDIKLYGKNSVRRSIIPLSAAQLKKANAIYHAVSDPIPIECFN